MEEKFYTIDQIAEILGMHHKTIRKFIEEGTLKANKVGKQWRISGHDLSLFMEDTNDDVKNSNKSESEKIEFSTDDINSNNKTSKINVSTVIDINEIDIDSHRRISNMLLALMNSKDSKMSNSTINIKYYKNDKNLKIMLWGDIEFIRRMLDFIYIITETNNL